MGLAVYIKTHNLIPLECDACVSRPLVMFIYYFLLRYVAVRAKLQRGWVHKVYKPIQICCFLFISQLAKNADNF